MPGYPGYFATRDGKVLSQKSGALRELSQRVRDGYHVVELWVGGRVRWVFVHRCVLLAFRGLPRADQQTRHLNGRRGDNRLENLAWGTAVENSADSLRHGTAVGLRHQGDGHPRSKLTEADVREVERRARAGHDSLRSIGREFGISHEHVRWIRDHRAWGHLWPRAS